jgi:anti-sigma regulatory factor (Ser/Thr protein kinase)
LVLNGNLSELGRLTAETERFCGEHSLPADVEFDLHLVLEELFVNGIRHGGCEGVQAAAEFHFGLTPAGVTLEYADRGKEFDPTKVPEADVKAPIEHRPLGGLGIHLMRQIMRDIEYHRVDGWNRIRMRRPIPSEGA